MTLRIAELHHFAVRIGPGPDAAAAALRFYNDVLGLESDHVPWDRPGEGQRINAGAHAQIHLVPGAAKPGLSTSGMDLGAPHIACAVTSIEEAQAELDRLAIPYRVVHGRLGPESRRIFIADPDGNLIELHQLGTCRCTARARDGIGQARVSGTVLFADMRGFTAVAERLAPSDVVPLLNEYFAMLTTVTREHGGTEQHERQTEQNPEVALEAPLQPADDLRVREPDLGNRSGAAGPAVDGLLERDAVEPLQDRPDRGGRDGGCSGEVRVQGGPTGRGDEVAQDEEAGECEQHADELDDVGGDPGVALDPCGTEPQGQRERLQRVLRSVRPGTAVSERDRRREQRRQPGHTVTVGEGPLAVWARP